MIAELSPPLSDAEWEAAELRRQRVTFSAEEVRRALGIVTNESGDSTRVVPIYPCPEEQLGLATREAQSHPARAMARNDPHGNQRTWHQVILTLDGDSDDEGRDSQLNPQFLPPSAIIDVLSSTPLLGGVLSVSVHPTEFVVIFERGAAQISPCSPPTSVLRRDPLALGLARSYRDARK